MRLRIVLSALVVMLLVAVEVRAQNQPAQRTGQEVPTAYAAGDVDAVQLFNGNLVISLPIGGSYPLSPALSLQLALQYNSNTWDFSEGGFLITGEQTVIARPSPHSNAGLGWNLTVGGTLYEGNTPIFNEGATSWLLVEPDGTRRFFADDLHHGDPEPNGNGVFYSQDGSYFRLKVLSSTIVEIESPSSVIRRYARIPSTGIFELAEIRDRFGNRTEVTAGFVGFQPAWFVKDYAAASATTVVREHRIIFDIFEYDGWQLKQVRQVRLAKFGGGFADYNFEYSEESPGVPREISRHHKHTADELPPGPEHVPQLVRVPLLERVDLGTDVGDDPDFVMTYYDENDNNPQGGPNDFNISGTISSLRLPTHGLIEWTYGRYEFNLGFNPDPPHLWANTNDGVRTRAVSSTVSDTPAGTWRYEQLLRPNGFPCQGGCDLSSEVRTWVTDPLNQTTIHYFHTEGGSWKHGLPFTQNVPDGNGLFLSRQIFSSGTPNTGTNLKRSEWVAYTADWNPSLSEGRENQRLVGAKTLFDDDAGRWIKTAFTDFDGLGHHRVATTSASSNFDGLPTRVETTFFNSTVGTFAINPDNGNPLPGHNFVMLPIVDPWILETFTYRQQTEGAVDAKQEFSFDLDLDVNPGTGTGFLNSVRTLKTGTGRSLNDLFHLRCKGTGGQAGGFAVIEGYYGGDAPHALPGPSPNGTLPTCASLGTWGYRLDHVYESGSLKSSKYRDPTTGPMPFFSYEADIDQWTGKASSEYDVSDYRTAFDYDSLGRLKWIEPKGNVVSEAGARTSYTYGGAAGNTGVKISVTTACPPNAGCTTTFGSRHVVLDGFGRVKIERYHRHTGLGDSHQARRDTRYNALGWKTQVSEWDTPWDNAPDEWTYFMNFDVFGRPGKARLPDWTAGNEHEAEFVYTGVRQLQRKSRVKTALGSGSETLATTTETYDRYGRLVKVQEPSGGVPTTDYAYDIGGRLKSVVQTSGLSTQTRTFTYDNRGFLGQEVHPEKDQSPNPDPNLRVGLYYTEYDARGHAHKVQDGPIARLLQFDFDKAERLERIISVSGGNTMKEWTYYGSGNSLGKVQTAMRGNVTSQGTFTVTETMTYGGYERRLTGRTTLINKNGVNQETFSQGWTYGRDGSVDTVVYPTCAGGICSSGAPAGRTVANVYSNGFLTAVTGWASSITYHPNQLVNQVVHLNGVTDTVANDADTMRRPQSISTSGVTGGLNWSSGTYTYDGTGNIEAIGSTEYAYDLVSRLYNSNVEGKNQEYSFDAFGNIQWIKTAGVQVNYPTTQTTNRLTSGSYGPSGILQSWNGSTYTYDFLNMMKRYVNNAEDTSYVYTADDERIMYILTDCSIGSCGPKPHWTIRDLDGKVLRQITGETGGGGGSVVGGSPDGTAGASLGGFASVSDYIYRDGQLLASAPAGSTSGNHFHLDHLGTPRLFTTSTGARISQHSYFPFGQEATDTDQDAERMKFTGHERDLLGSADDPADDLDYMHARYYSPLSARFNSFDPEGGLPSSPQTWNRYEYGLLNPLKYVDSDGRTPGPGLWIASLLATHCDPNNCTVVYATPLDNPFGRIDASNSGNRIVWGTPQYAREALLGAHRIAKPGADLASSIFAAEMTVFTPGAFLASEGAAIGTIGLGVTIHGSQRLMTAGRLTYSEVMQTMKAAEQVVTSQRNGATVYIAEVAPGKFNVAIWGERGFMSSFKHLSRKELEKMAQKYGWAVK